MPTLGTPIAPELLQPGSRWILNRGLNGYARASGSGLATQARAGRRFEVLTTPVQRRVRVRLLEDCLLYTSPSPRDGLLSRMPSSA